MSLIRKHGAVLQAWACLDLVELVMIRDNMLQLSSDVFSLMDIRDVISFFMYKLIAYLYVFE